MVASSFSSCYTPSCESRSLLSYSDEIWQISWGDNDITAAIREEMTRAAQASAWQRTKASQHSTWQNPTQSQTSASNQPQANQAAGNQVAKFQATGFMMTRIPGTQYLVPAVVLTTQDDRSGGHSAHAAPTSMPQAKLSTHSHSAGTAPGRRTPDITANPASIEEDQAALLANFDGEFPSVGSEGHFDGSCKRCAFFPKGRCQNGKDCTHCHFPHERRSRLRKRASRASKSQEQEQDEEEIALDDVLPRAEVSSEDCLAEVLLYFSEEAEESSVAACDPVLKEVQADFNDKLEVSTTATVEDDIEKVSTAAMVDDDAGKAAVMNFNNALRKVAEAYMGDSDSEVKSLPDLAAADCCADRADVECDTTPSISALSDGEDITTTSMVDSEETSVTDISQGSQEQGPSHKDDVLKEATPSWSAMHSNRNAGTLKTPVDIGRSARSLLNKLTEARFESICCQILALPFSTPEELAIVVAEIFQKATTQNCFRGLYTELCMRLDAHLAPQSSIIGGKAFRKALVNGCQATFEQSLQPSDASLFDGLSGDDRFEAEMKLKTRILGNVRFIGDLLNRRLLAPKLLPPIVHELLHGDEAALESLIALLAIVAPEFEAKPSLYQAPLREAFTVLRKRMDSKSVCPRMCCQINDLLDAKARGWCAKA